MSILKDFYSIENITNEGNKYSVNIKLNPAHEIYRGHFPDNPVVPGVCMMQIIKEITAQIAEKKLTLISASNVKFMSIINPNINPHLLLELDILQDGETVKVKNATYFGETIALKLTVNYKTA